MAVVERRPARLSERARAGIERAGAVGVSALSCWELNLSVARGRIALDRDAATWVRQALAAEGVVVVDLHPAAAVAAAQLRDDFPRDPVDRLLYATAVELDVLLVTKDRALRVADPVRTLW